MNSARSTPAPSHAFDDAEPPLLRDLIRTALGLENEKEAVGLIRVHAAASYDQTDEWAVSAVLEAEIKDHDAAIDALTVEINHLEKIIAEIPPFIKSGAQQPGGRLPLWKRPGHELAALALISASVVTLLPMSAVSVFSNLMASGPPFTDQPSLAACLSVLAPIGSVAIKCISHIFESRATRKRYAACLYAATSIAFGSWLVFFAFNFSGLGALDWDSVGNTGTGPWLALSQISAEVLAGASLFMAAEDLSSKYLDNAANPERILPTAARDACIVKREAMRGERNQKRARFMQGTKARETFINRCVAYYTSCRARLSLFDQF